VARVNGVANIGGKPMEGHAALHANGNGNGNTTGGNGDNKERVQDLSHTYVNREVVAELRRSVAIHGCEHLIMQVCVSLIIPSRWTHVTRVTDDCIVTC
jgi:hypothetical protein